MQSYLLRFLAIKQVADTVKKWRSDEKNNTILHLACMNCRIKVVE
jgi:ankyrin repeat protein